MKSKALDLTPIGKPHIVLLCGLWVYVQRTNLYTSPDEWDEAAIMASSYCISRNAQEGRKP